MSAAGVERGGHPSADQAAAHLRALTAARDQAAAARARALAAGDAATAVALDSGLAEVAPALADAEKRWTGALAAELMVEPWDPRRDLMVLVGRGAVSVGAAAAARGQRRIFCLDPSAPHCPPTPRDMPAVVNGQSPEELEQACWWLAWPHPAALRVRPLDPAALPIAQQLGAQLDRTLRAVDQAGSEIESSSYLFVHCATRNLPRIAAVPSIAPLAGACAGRTAVVVSAGPSLDRNIAQLRALQGRAVIIGINQTVRALRAAGVRPDVVVAVDPQNLAYQFEGVRGGEIGTLVLGASVDDALFDVPADRTVTFASSPMPEGWIYEAAGEKAALQSGGTVATAAIQVALHLGCARIVLVGRDLALAGKRYYSTAVADGGQDLALCEDGRTFNLGAMTSKLKLAPAEAAPEMARRLAATRIEPIEVPGFYGTPVVSYPGFLFEMDILRAIVQRERGRARFINATEGGAHLAGMDHCALAEVIATEPTTPFDARGAMARLLDGVDQGARRRRLQTELRAMAADMRRAQNLGRAAVRLAKRAGAGGSPKLTRTAEELDLLSRRHPILAVLTQRTVRDVSRKDRQGWGSLAEVARAEAALYQSLANVAADVA
ncbi:MAG: 6-hydroxymethylpterin diphosphokinase MptE-like protein, partial [Pseudomonadota bacterium]